MKIKPQFTIHQAVEVLRHELSSHIKVIPRKNIFDKSLQWIDVDKNAFVGVRVYFYLDQPLVDTYVPNFFARMFFGGLISGIFHHAARSEFKDQIERFIKTEFYME
jgi:hypothetical protein